MASYQVRDTSGNTFSVDIKDQKKLDELKSQGFEVVSQQQAPAPTQAPITKPVAQAPAKKVIEEQASKKPERIQPQTPKRKHWLYRDYREPFTKASRAASLSAVTGFTIGGDHLLLRSVLNKEDYQKFKNYRKRLKEENPVSSFVGEMAGSVPVFGGVASGLKFLGKTANVMSQGKILKGLTQIGLTVDGYGKIKHFIKAGGSLAKAGVEGAAVIGGYSVVMDANKNGLENVKVIPHLTMSAFINTGLRGLGLLAKGAYHAGKWVGKKIDITSPFGSEAISSIPANVRQQARDFYHSVADSSGELQKKMVQVGVESVDKAYAKHINPLVKRLAEEGKKKRPDFSLKDVREKDVAREVRRQSISVGKKIGEARKTIEKNSEDFTKILNLKDRMKDVNFYKRLKAEKELKQMDLLKMDNLLQKFPEAQLHRKTGYIDTSKSIYAGIKDTVKGKWGFGIGNTLNKYNNELLIAAYDTAKRSKIPKYLTWSALQKMKNLASKNYALSATKASAKEAKSSEIWQIIYGNLKKKENKMAKLYLRDDKKYQEFIKNKETYEWNKIYDDLLKDREIKKALGKGIKDIAEGWFQTYQGVFITTSVGIMMNIHPVFSAAGALIASNVNRGVKKELAKQISKPFKKGFFEQKGADLVDYFGRGKYKSSGPYKFFRGLERGVKDAKILDNFTKKSEAFGYFIGQGATKGKRPFAAKTNQELQEPDKKRSPQSVKPIDKVKTSFGLKKGDDSGDLINLLKRVLENPDLINQSIRPADDNFRSDGYDATADSLYMNTMNVKGALKGILPEPENREEMALNPDARPTYSKEKIRQFDNNMVAFFNPLESMKKILTGDYSTEEIGILKMAYPSFYQESMFNLVQGVRQSKKALSNDQMMRLYRLTGFAVSPSVTPEFMIYNSYMEEGRKNREEEDVGKVNKKIDTISKMGSVQTKLQKREDNL